ncbi:MAG: hypothetical protein IJM90_02310 [Firmicutes bacterium]|nr:hypothetical protein [Bacillota bacterium]
MLSVKTELLKESDESLEFRTCIVVPPRHIFGQAPGRTKEYALDYQLNRSGTLAFDNRQPQAFACRKWRISRALAEEMHTETLRRIPAALSGRTTKGLCMELIVHYWAFRFKFLMKYAVVTDIGSAEPDAPDYDSNAAWFEHPVRSIPDIIRETLRRLRAARRTS